MVVEARFEKDHFVCGKCGADLGFMRIDPGSRNINIRGARIAAACGHENVVTDFHKD